MKRTRRLRQTEKMRQLVRETRVSVEDLIYPIFVIEGENIKNPIPSMPGIFQYSLDRLDEELEKICSLHIGGILLFGIPKHKDSHGTSAYDDEGVICRAIRYIKHYAPELLIIADVCLCEYTDHGHCGIVKDGKILNDETVAILSQVALCYARAGADIIAPSDMMDGRVGAIRQTLDANGFYDTPILSYAAKFCSALYSPFRDAAHSAPSFGDRKTYQMDYANRREAFREVETDLEEGADAIIAKPALAYMDIIRDFRERFYVPIFAYHVSGEYAMVKSAVQNGWIDEKKVVLEIMTGLKRAGADCVITYHALDVARWLKEEKSYA